MTRPHWIGPVLGAAALLGLGCSGTIEGTATSSSSPASPGQKPGGPGLKPVGMQPVGMQPVVDPPTACAQLGVSPLHRLTRLEYDNTVRELIGEDLKLAREFTEDERAGEFAGNFFAPISELQLGQYAAAASAAADRAVALLPKMVPCDPSAGDAACAAKFIRQFGRRAFRRPLEEVEAARYEQLFELGRGQVNDGFAHGIELVVETMLQSPHFLYLVEGPGALTHHQLAARLSYFLWKAPPDAKLAALADAGQLGTPEALRKEAERMLADPRAQAMIIEFHTQWLGLGKLEKLPKDAALYPTFGEIRGALGEETRRFVKHVLTEGDGRLETLLTAPYSVLDGSIASLYGAKAGAPGTWQKVALDPAQRAGLLTHGSFLAMHGALEGSSPIRRGLAVRERLFCAEVPSPPPGADAEVPQASPSMTTRQRFDKHRTNASCASCHTLMDLLGYGFESYDGIGQHRTTENGVPVDDSGVIMGTDVDGPFRGAPELARRLAQSRQVRECVATQWFYYAFARLDTAADRCVIDSIHRRFADAGFRMCELALAVVESDAFRTYRGEPTQ